MSWKKFKLGDLVKDLTEERKILISDEEEIYEPTINTQEHKIIVRSMKKGILLRIKERVLIKKGDLVFSKLHTQNGAFAFSDREFKATTTFLPLHVDEKKINKDYLFWLLHLNVPRLRASDTVGRETYKTRDILNLEFQIPFLEEQDKIIQSFLCLKEKILILREETNHNLFLTKKLHQSILQEAVQGKLVKQDPTDEPASKLLEKIKEEKEKLIKEKKLKKEKTPIIISIDEISYNLPDGWVWCRLGEVIRVISGYGFESGDFNKSGGIKCIKITNAGIGKFIETGDYLPSNYIKKYSNFLAYEGDLVLALTRPFISGGLKISKCPKNYNNSLINQRVAVLRSYKGLNKDYCYLFMISPIVLKNYKKRFINVSQQPNLKIKDINNLLIPLPPLLEQKRIVEKVDQLMKFCDGLEKQVKENENNSERLVNAVLNEAFVK